MSLPTKKTPIKTDLSDQSILIYGLEKIGKSSFCAEMDNPLFLTTEAGLNFLEVHQMEISTWKEFLDSCRLLKEDEHEFKTVVIDILENLYGMCQEHVCKGLGIKFPDDEGFGFGKGWGLVNTEFKRALIKLARLSTGLVMICHAKEKEFKDRTSTYNKTIPNLSNGASNVVVGMADFTLFFGIQESEEDGVKEQKRVIFTKPDKYHVAGSRTNTHVTDAAMLPEVIDLDYKTFLTEYKKAIKGKEK